VFGCVSGSIALPVLQQIRVTRPVRITLLVEASLGDVLGVLTVSVLLSLGSGAVVTGFVAGTVLKVLACIVGAIVAGVLWTRVLRTLAEQRFWQVMTLSIVLLVYAGAQAASQGGLIAVFAFGLTLANLHQADPWGVASTMGLGPGEPQHHVQILSFHSELAFLVRSFFFILLGVIVKISGLQGYVLLTAGVFVALAVARWLAVTASSWTWGEKDASEKRLALLFFPRGLITAVLAIEVIQARGAAFSFLPALAFAIIFLTNLLVIVASVRAGTPPSQSPPAPLRGDEPVTSTAS
ncbi:MAG: cation:proton antiporter, partial [Terriglobia bacterium]